MGLHTVLRQNDGLVEDDAPSDARVVWEGNFVSEEGQDLEVRILEFNQNAGPDGMIYETRLPGSQDWAADLGQSDVDAQAVYAIAFQDMLRAYERLR